MNTEKRHTTIEQGNESANMTQITDEKLVKEEKKMSVPFSDFGTQCKSNDEATGYKRHRFGMLCMVYIEHGSRKRLSAFKMNK